MPSASRVDTSHRLSEVRLHEVADHSAEALGGEYRFDPWVSATMDLKGGDHWLLSYVDMLTLLLTILVVLLVLQPKPSPTWPVITPQVMQVAKAPVTVNFQIKSLDIRPIHRIQNREISISEDVPDKSSVVTDSLKETVSLEPLEISEMPVLPQRSPRLAPVESQLPEKNLPQGAERKYQLLERLMTERIDERLNITRVTEGVNLEMRDNVLFDPGSAELKQEGERLLASLARVLSDGQGLLSVEGHTDDRPIANSRFPSNWELSTGRASAVSRFLIRQGLDAARLRAIGYASTRPSASNATPEGRAHNRRVSLVVHLQKEQPEPAP